MTINMAMKQSHELISDSMNLRVPDDSKLTETEAADFIQKSKSILKSIESCSEFLKIHDAFYRRRYIEGSAEVFEAMNSQNKLLDDFIKLNPDSQFKVLKSLINHTAPIESLDLYIRTLRICNREETVLVRSDYKDLKAFVSPAKRTFRSLLTKERVSANFQFSVDALANFTQGVINRKKSNYYNVSLGFASTDLTLFSTIRTSMVLLRERFGEDSVIALCELWTSNSHDLSFEVFLKILENWDELKEYPLEWTLSLLDTDGISERI